MTKTTEKGLEGGKFQSEGDRVLWTDFDFGIDFFFHFFPTESLARHSPRDVSSSELAFPRSLTVDPLNFLHNTYSFLPGWLHVLYARREQYRLECA